MTESTLDFAEFDFSGAMKDLTAGLIIKPLLRNYLFDASFPDFDLHFRKRDLGARKPDGWFHASTHPLMNEKALYTYLAEPENFPTEVMQPGNTLAVTYGKVFHELLQVCLEDMGFLPKELQVCTTCPPEADCHEPSVVDEVCGERGHTDGFLDLSSLKHIPADKVESNLELKSANDGFGKLTALPDLDLALFRKRWPEYYAQQQSYLRMSGKKWTILIVMEHQFPFTMREFHIPYDPGFSAGVAAKYQRVRQAAADQAPPRCCGKKGCLVYANCSRATR